ncbi:sigma-54-dependent transcriptional regulator [Endozoicomonas numazuensis]|uniref:Fis family transcriptional regulator n=1 Tax=Endozoicomonas numazuensis TaxID=1137799 RepID=A0A081ND44_9GAMM|nr:sigma-54 dependent transcriptional regulator [Endozoicomonas numazuensis]KEQ16367.1 hypothetical protein GZ78_21025 [Endozoicomonas numazuensis]
MSNKGNILIVGDKPEGNSDLREKLKDAHYRVEQIVSAERALKVLHKGMVDLIIADFQRSPQDSLGFLNKMRALNNKPPVIITADQPDIEQAVAAMKAGASDYFADSDNSDQLLVLMEKCLKSSNTPSAAPIAVASASQKTLQMAQQVAQSDATVLITGESGTGKEVLARYIHLQSPRKSGPFIAINCAAIPDNLLESELFGHTRGSFTGALSDQAGRFEQANSGTLLLDEIGELPSNLQAKLLRVLQEKEVERVGGRTSIKLDVRVLAATNQNLQEAVQNGQFRADLFYRINVFPLTWAPLRERKEDIIPLAEYFLENLASERDILLSQEARERLNSYQWPGNVRELENVIQRALVMCQNNMISAGDLMLEVQVIHSTDSQLMVEEPSRDITSPSGEVSLESKRKQEEFKHIIRTLRLHDGHRSKTAEALGVTTRTLRNKLADMRKEGMDVEVLIKQP